MPEEEGPVDELLFMYNRASCHRANDVMNYLDNQVDFLPWSPQSSNLNIMENIWPQPLNKNYGRKDKSIY